MKTKAAVLVELGRPLVIAELEVPALRPGQVLVEVTASGVCHTQLLEARGHRGPDAFLPHCLGHEGVGIVREVGPQVTKVKSGDTVLLSWMQGAGATVGGTTYDWNGRKVNAGPIATFSQHAVASESRLTVLKDALPTATAAMVGCALATGAGMIFNTAQARPGQSVAVFGAGGIGLCAVAGAAVAGCTPIIAVDLKAEKLGIARALGATHEVLVGRDDVAATIAKLCPDGVDFAIEATGRPEVMAQALASVRKRGGTAVIAGNAHLGEKIPLDPAQLNQGKRLVGSWGGDNIPDQDFPRYVRLLRTGKLDLTPLHGKVFSLGRVNEALDALEAGTVARPLIDMSLD